MPGVLRNYCSTPEKVETHLCLRACLSDNSALLVEQFQQRASHIVCVRRVKQGFASRDSRKPDVISDRLQPHE